MKRIHWQQISGEGEVAAYLRDALSASSRTEPGGALGLDSGAARIVPPPPPAAGDDNESPDVWGFRDSGFELLPNGSITMRGKRYPLCDQELPHLIPWIRGVLQVPLDLGDTNPSAYPPEVPEPRVHPAFASALQDFLAEDQRSDDALERLRHGHGHTQEEMYRIKYGRIDRVPDLVVWPTEEDQVVRLVAAALEHDVCLVPYGGGTSVTEALQCPENEERLIVSVDMRRMNRILWIDPTNRMAHIEAGAVGRHIVDQLAEYGFTMGHEPDSVEFSTLGGWVATHASGMKKNKYGNIEDLLLDVRAVTPMGTLERAYAAPRESVGMDPRLSLLGSEGTLGIITSAVVKLFPLPEVQSYGSVLFPTFEDGVAFMYDLTLEGAQPASVRLVDNLQFQFSMALKPKSVGWRAKKSAFEKFLVTRVKGFDPERMVACTLVFEGSRREVASQESAVYRLGSKHGGMKAGGANGERGYQLTFGIAYIRDFVMNYYVLGESFETSVPWSRTLDLCANVKRRIYAEHEKRGLPGRPFVTCRVTQVYDTGVCVYFYLAYCYKGVENPTQVFAEVEEAAREEILASGGSLSHHHGVGKLRKRFLPEIMSETSLDWNRRAKRAIDPTNVFGTGNQLLDEAAPASSPSARLSPPVAGEPLRPSHDA